MKWKMFIIAALAYASLCGARREYSVDDWLTALKAVESRTLKNNGEGSRQDAGELARGPYNIHYKYWQDAKMPDGTWSDCDKKEYSDRVVVKYMERYCPAAFRNKDFHHASRVHLLGPKGSMTQREPLESKAETYWLRVKSEMENGGK